MTTTLAAARLLIVDDELAQMDALCDTLELEGYVTRGFGSAKQALASLRPGEYDLLLTDLMMPEMDGITLINGAQQVDSAIGSIVMTGHGTIDTAVKALQGGALDYILKPFKLNVILTVISRALEVQRLRRENIELVRHVANRSTELETSNRELRGVNKELDAFTRSVSHDLRQPLNVVIGFAELLISEKPGMLNDKQREFLGEIHNGGTHLVRLTEDLLRFARLSHQAIKKQDVNMEGLVWEILRSMQTPESNPDIGLHVGPLPDASADPSLLRQLLVNLLSNAFKFTRHVSQPRIEVTGQLGTGQVTYRICDNGAGFDMADAHRLFGVFQRLHSDTAFEGTGVGLSIAQRIVERHGGTITAEAVIGKGATFTFAIPT